MHPKSLIKTTLTISYFSLLFSANTAIDLVVYFFKGLFREKQSENLSKRSGEVSNDIHF